MWRLPIQAGGSPRFGTSIPSAANPQPPGTIGEDPRQEPTNLFSVIAQVLKGERPALDIFGSGWDTCDGTSGVRVTSGTAVRECIHVVDLARG